MNIRPSGVAFSRSLSMSTAKTALVLIFVTTLAVVALLACRLAGSHLTSSSTSQDGLEKATIFERQALSLPMTFGAQTRRQSAYTLRRAAISQQFA
jgi:hypothetical protein